MCGGVFLASTKGRMKRLRPYVSSARSSSWSSSVVQSVGISIRGRITPAMGPGRGARCWSARASAVGASCSCDGWAGRLRLSSFFRL